MTRDDVTGIIGAISSSIIVMLGFLWNIGVLQLIFSFLAGSFTTYLVQHKLQLESEKRKISRENDIAMRDLIYGPMFVELNDTLERVKEVQPLLMETRDNLDAVLSHYLYPIVNNDLRTKLLSILDRYEKYSGIRRATEVLIRDFIKDEIQEIHKIDIGSNENTPSISLLIGKVHVAWTSLQRILLLKIEPEGYVQMETQKWERPNIEVSIEGNRGDLKDFKLLHSNVLSKIKEETLFQEEEKQRNYLINELETFLKKMRSFVEL